MATEAVNVVLPFHFRYARGAGDLEAIHAPGVNLVVWRREQEPQMSGLVDAFNAAHELDVEAILQSDEPDVWMFLSDLPACGARDMLAADIDYLVRRFGRITGRPALRVHLETVATDACRLFHVDAAALRLLVTQLRCRQPRHCFEAGADSQLQAVVGDGAEGRVVSGQCRQRHCPSFSADRDGR